LAVGLACVNSILPAVEQDAPSNVDESMRATTVHDGRWRLPWRGHHIKERAT
jgi:hypothetical protein